MEQVTQQFWATLSFIRDSALSHNDTIGYQLDYLMKWFNQEVDRVNKEEEAKAQAAAMEAMARPEDVTLEQMPLNE